MKVSFKNYACMLLVSASLNLLLTTPPTVMAQTEKSAGLPNCMYCKRQDSVSSFLYSYSYCPELDECLGDSWNYYNRPCPSQWKAGYTLDLDEDCKAQYAHEYICPKPIKAASANDMGRFQNFTNMYLPAGTKCKIKVDASEVATLFVLSNNTNLGTTFNHYRVGKDLIAVKQGETIEFEIYNGNDNTTTIPLSYGYGYKSAMQLVSSLSLLSAIILGLMY